MEREIVLDTETTGLDPAAGDRIVEIAAVELVNFVPTDVTYQQYINPKRPMSEGAREVTGLADEFLADFPVFSDVVDAFLDFVGDAKLVIHNAAFDIRFLDHELDRLGRPGFGMGRAVDTLALARQKFPGAPASLDALCKRFDVDASARVKHGALLDCELLAEVYLHLIGGRQPGLAFDVAKEGGGEAVRVARRYREPRPHEPTAEELAAHAAFISTITDPIWRRGD
ncbi:MAG: DNA polymerase III subunit epsilon [Geminicoccaceae bacterium]